MKNFAVKIFALYLFFSIFTLGGGATVAKGAVMVSAGCNEFSSNYYYSMARNWWFSPAMYASMMALGNYYDCD